MPGTLKIKVSPLLQKIRLSKRSEVNEFSNEQLYKFFRMTVLNSTRFSPYLLIVAKKITLLTYEDRYLRVRYKRLRYTAH